MCCDPRDWIAVSQVPGLGPATLAKLTAAGYTPVDILAQQLPDTVRLRTDTRHFLKYNPAGKLYRQADQLLRVAESLELQVIGFDCPGYPPLLREIHDPPAVLWLRGDVKLLFCPQLAVVGSRKPSRSGLQSALQLSACLAGAGFVITSGLAQGVDTAAHQGALNASKPTLAVLGSSPELIYPRCNMHLADRILAQGGALVSEFPPGTRPRPEHFPRRNRIISGLSVGTLVVEAALRSGSLITARLAMEQGREVFALPGALSNPLARGCHALIREGAILAETPEHICEPLAPLLGYLQDSSAEMVDKPDTAPVAPELQPLLSLLRQESWSLDELRAETGVSVSELQQQLIKLELIGKIAITGNRYTALA
ncbi:DNA-processing protein DprA [Nitrincola iocasae]|uniref:DNA-protecting protein DprA n=1 Tax=Nitrincola iocasae TaxID=2614693 RepID=A0A5J6L9T0_9GAMM|nr:DNA-processing protein DprA [Nitrincola iocasae]QEW05022.1 DNA-protecting protein DprA [Nitrincola iocasae]